MTYTFSFIRFSVTEIFHSELSLTSKDGNIAETLMAPASALLAHLGFVLAGSRGRSWRSAAVPHLASHRGEGGHREYTQLGVGLYPPLRGVAGLLD